MRSCSTKDPVASWNHPQDLRSEEISAMTCVHRFLPCLVVRLNIQKQLLRNGYCLGKTKTPKICRTGLNPNGYFHVAHTEVPQLKLKTNLGVNKPHTYTHTIPLYTHPRKLTWNLKKDPKGRNRRPKHRLTNHPILGFQPLGLPGDVSRIVSGKHLHLDPSSRSAHPELLSSPGMGHWR